MSETTGTELPEFNADDYTPPLKSAALSAALDQREEFEYGGYLYRVSPSENETPDMVGDEDSFHISLMGEIYLVYKIS